ncbi:MAG: 2-octaprenyl-6-methoxyphenyl hydroxylase [Kangiellaceae bacterium]|nr:2-octaprenyl-6-methoxyphenyl hydroxylase [Kangiellaceae bacterium]
MNNTAQQYDIIIIGGGMVGACTALALAQLDLSIAVIDKFVFDASQQPSFDDRSVALSYGSMRILQSLGLADAIKSVAEPIKHIHVSDRGHYGFTRLHADEFKIDALGYVVENLRAGRAFYRMIEQSKLIDVIAPAKISRVDNSQSGVVVKYQLPEAEQTGSVSAKLLVAADGTQSVVADFLNMDSKSEAYRQSAAIANVTTAKSHNGWAYERFTDSGPLAMLPLTDRRLSLVWSFDNDQIDHMKALTDEQFIAALQERFGYRLGAITRVGKRSFYPLQQKRLLQGWTTRVVFIGNALHTCHPVAGQGFNLGIRDIAQLTENIAFALRVGDNFFSDDFLRYFIEQRQPDIEQTLAATDSLTRLFINNYTPLVVARNIALKALDSLPMFKAMFAEQAMGINDQLPALARGMSVKQLSQLPIPNVMTDMTSV